MKAHGQRGRMRACFGASKGQPAQSTQIIATAKIDTAMVLTRARLLLVVAVRAAVVKPTDSATDNTGIGGAGNGMLGGGARGSGEGGQGGKNGRGGENGGAGC